MTRLITPQGKPSDYKTFAITQPAATHWLPATCEQVECEQWKHGWWSEFDTRTPQGQFQETYVRHSSGRAFRQVLERPNGEPLPAGIVRFEFPPGQQCFRASEHKTRLEDVPAVFSTRTGDYRVNTTPLVCSADGWVNQFLENDERLKRQQESTRE
jgi:hypothetical protein